jgi:hypothetical protein
VDSRTYNSLAQEMLLLQGEHASLKDAEHRMRSSYVGELEKCQVLKAEQAATTENQRGRRHISEDEASIYLGLGYKNVELGMELTTSRAELVVEQEYRAELQAGWLADELRAKQELVGEEHEGRLREVALVAAQRECELEVMTARLTSSAMVSSFQALHKSSTGQWMSQNGEHMQQLGEAHAANLGLEVRMAETVRRQDSLWQGELRAVQDLLETAQVTARAGADSVRELRSELHSLSFSKVAGSGHSESWSATTQHPSGGPRATISLGGQSQGEPE